MPRPERPIDESAGELAKFAGDLRRLRESAGSPAYRQLGQRAHYSPSTLAEAAGGQRLPSLEVTLAYVRACGGDAGEWEERWRVVADVRESVADRVRAPYVGLTPFGEEDAEWFFGRDQLVDQLVTRVAERPFVAVFGASGSGKSSLLGAGLVAAARSGVLDAGTSGNGDGNGDGPADWKVSTMTPGAAPALPGDQGPGRLLVVDQFEEVFTLCRDDAERSRFVDALLAAAAAGTHVVIAVRTDFYTHCSAHPRLATALQDNQFLVGPMTTEELRRAVVQPAVRAGYTVEGALVTELVAEAAGQPGTLPLVSHALMETFQHKRGNALTLASYQAVGGMRGAAARTAEDTYATLTGPQQDLAKDVFVRLTALGEGTEDTKRRIDLDELDADADLDAVLAAFIGARLVTVDGSTIEIAHEALIRSWPRLRGWLAEDRDGLRVHRQLTEASAIWVSLDRDPGALYRGTRLATAREWSSRHRLGSQETAFLDASAAADRDERLRTQRRNRQLRWLAVALTVLLVAALGISVIALGQRQEALTQQRIAQSRQLAAQAESVAPKDAGKAIRWALEAYDAHPTTEARSILLSLASRPAHTARLARTTAESRRVVFSPDGKMLVTNSAGRKRVELWDAERRTRTAVLEATLSGNYDGFAFDPDSSRLAAVGSNGQFQRWDLARGARLDFHEGRTPNADIAIRPDLGMVASADLDGRVRLRDTATGGTVAAWDSPAAGVSQLTFSNDGSTLAVAGRGGTISLWDLRTRVREDLRATGPVTAVAFDATGRWLAGATENGTITLWDLVSTVPPQTMDGYVGPISGLAFQPGTDLLVSTGQDNRVTFWDRGEKRPMLTRLQTDESDLGIPTFSPDGHTLAVPADEATLLWDAEDLPLLGHRDGVRGLDYRTGGSELVSIDDEQVFFWDSGRGRPEHRYDGSAPYIWSGFGVDESRLVLAADNGDVVVWNLATRQVKAVDLQSFSNSKMAVSPTRPVLAAVNSSSGGLVLWDIERARQLDSIPPPRGPIRSITTLEFLPDGKTLVVGRSEQETLELWDIDTRELVGELPAPDDPTLVAASPAVLATVGRSGTVRLWDRDGHAQVAELNGHTGGIEALAFPTKGNLLATAGTDNKVILWDVTTGTRWATLSGHTDDVTSATWHPDGTHLATGGDDNTITVWTTDPETAVEHLCRRLTEDFPDRADPPPAVCL